MPNPWNVNEMTEEEFEKLKESIKITKGKYLRENPIEFRRNGLIKKLEIVDGEHRWRACIDLGIEKIPAKSIEIDTDKAQKLNVIYSMNRGQINYYKLSKLLNDYYNAHDISQDNLSKEFGFSDKRIINRIMKIFQRIEVVHARLFSNHNLMELARVKDDYLRLKLIEKSIDNKWNSKTIRTQATKLNQISQYIGSITDNLEDKQQLLDNLSPETLFDFDFGAIKNRIKSVFNDISKKKIIHGDAFEEIPKLEQNADHLITDWPFNLTEIGDTYNLEGRKPISTEFGEWDKFTQQEYLTFMEKFLNLVIPKINEGGSFLIHTSDHFVSYLRDIMIKIGLKYRSTLYWHKTNPTNSVQKNRDVSSVELIAYATKGDSRTYNWLGQNKAHNFIETSICMGKERTTHPTQKPLEVIKWLLEKYTNPGDLVLDPFAGSGSTGIACKVMGRNFILIEKEKEYLELIDMRFKALEEADN